MQGNSSKGQTQSQHCKLVSAYSHAFIDKAISDTPVKESNVFIFIHYGLSLSVEKIQDNKMYGKSLQSN